MYNIFSLAFTLGTHQKELKCCKELNALNTTAEPDFFCFQRYWGIIEVNHEDSKTCASKQYQQAD